MRGRFSNAQFCTIPSAMGIETPESAEWRRQQKEGKQAPAAPEAVRTSRTPSKAVAAPPPDPLVTAAFNKYGARFVEKASEDDGSPTLRGPPRLSSALPHTYRGRGGDIMTVNSDDDDDVAEAKRSAATQRAAAAQEERLARLRAEEESRAAKANQRAAEGAAARAEASARTASEHALVAKAAAQARALALGGPLPKPATSPVPKPLTPVESKHRAAITTAAAALTPVSAVAALASSPVASQGGLLLTLPPFVAAAALFKMDRSGREAALRSLQAGEPSRESMTALREALLPFFGPSLDSFFGLKTAASVAAPYSTQGAELLLPPHFDGLVDVAVEACQALEIAALTIVDRASRDAARDANSDDHAGDLLRSLASQAGALSASASALRESVSAAQASHSDWRRLSVLEQSLSAAPLTERSAADNGPVPLPPKPLLPPLPASFLPQPLDGSPRGQLPPVPASTPPGRPGSASKDFDLASLAAASRARILAKASPNAAAFFQMQAQQSPVPAATPASPVKKAVMAASPASPAGMPRPVGDMGEAPSPAFEWVQKGASWVRRPVAERQHSRGELDRMPHLAAIARGVLTRGEEE